MTCRLVMVIGTAFTTYSWCTQGFFEQLLKVTKIHVLLNENMQVINVVLTAGQINIPTKPLNAGVDLTEGAH